MKFEVELLDENGMPVALCKPSRYTNMRDVEKIWELFPWVTTNKIDDEVKGIKGSHIITLSGSDVGGWWPDQVKMAEAFGESSRVTVTVYNSYLLAKRYIKQHIIHALNENGVTHKAWIEYYVDYRQLLTDWGREGFPDVWNLFEEED